MGGITRIEIQQYSELSGKDTKFEITGHLGKVMTESISVAKTVVYNILSEKTRKDIAIKTKELDYHIHCCEGAVPKDGPSAGTAISVAMLSCILKVPISNKIAITGEIDIHGYMHAIGGLPDKVWGAQLAGIEYVFCPKENEEDMNRILDKVWYTGTTKIILANHICDEELMNKVFTKNIKNKLIKK
jgi:ATP-dependent Lon protease